MPFQAHSIRCQGSQRQERNRLQRRRQVEVRILYISLFLCIHSPCQLEDWKPILRTHEMRREGDGEGKRKRGRGGGGREEEEVEEENKKIKSSNGKGSRLMSQPCLRNTVFGFLLYVGKIATKTHCLEHL